MMMLSKPDVAATVTFGMKSFRLTDRIPRMSVMRIIVLHPFNKFEVRRPSRSEDMAEFLSLRH